MKVIHYTDQIYLHGGLERVLSNKLNYFSKNTDFELHVITFQQLDKSPCYEIDGKVVFHDLNIDYNRNISFLHPSNIKHAPKHFLRLRSKIKEIKPDVIVVCNYEYGFYFVPLIAKKAIKIKEYHSSGYFNHKTRSTNKNIFKKCIYAISEHFEKKYSALVLLTKDELKYYKSTNTTVIPNAINRISAETANLSNKKVISAGRIAPVKGFEYLIKSWATVIEIYPDWILEIYGDGADADVKKLEAQIKKSNLKNHVFLKGPTQRLEEKMLSSSIYVMSSLTECFPMVLLEAMSCGLPVVSFDCPNGPRHIITNEIDGILVEYLNENSLSEHLIHLIKNDTKRKAMGINAKENVKRFNEKAVMPLWVNLFSGK